MTGAGWVAAGCVTIAAILVCWPRPARHRSVLRPHLNSGRPARWPTPSLPRLSPRRTVLAVTGLAALAGAAAGGPVAAIAGGAYGGLAAGRLLRRRSTRAAAAERTRQLDNLCALAADLRAGLPISAVDPTGLGARAVGAPARAEVEPPNRLSLLTQAAWCLAEQTGAPLAELIERIEADARALDRAMAAAAAQVAGARATAWLLAGLPLAGIALGFGIGADPLQVLLHTPIGSGCAVGAIALQLTGLVWADRLGRVPAGVA